jgi:hypothetical protein
LRVNADGSVHAADAPPLFLVGDLGDRPERDGHIAPLPVDVTRAQGRPSPLAARRNLVLSFSPDARWLAIAGGGSGSGGDVPMPLPSWLRVVDLANCRIAQSIDGGEGTFPFVGWCVASDNASSE